LERRLVLNASLSLIGQPYLVDAEDHPLDTSAVPEGCPVFIHKEWTATDLPTSAGTYVVKNEVDGVGLWQPGGVSWGVGASGTTHWIEVWGGWKTTPGTHTASVTLDAFHSLAGTNESNTFAEFTFTTVAKPTVTIQATDAVATEAGLHAGVLTITRVGNTAFQMPVHLAVSGTATPGTDYTKLPDTVIMPAGVSSITVSVSPIDDGATDPRKTVVATVTPDDCYAIGTQGTATVGIKDNHTYVKIEATKPNASETGLVAGEFTLTRRADITDALTVQYTVSGTAKSGVDYVALPGTVTFPAGAATVTVLVKPLADTASAGIQSVVVTLTPNGTNSTNGYLVEDAGNGTVVVKDDASTSPKAQIDINGTTDKSDDITLFVPGVMVQTITAVVTNTGASGTMKLSVDPPGAAKLDQTELTLDHGKSATITITPQAVSKAPNDVTIKATSGDTVVGTATMTIVSVVIPEHIRNTDTPAGMPDRIPPRVNTGVHVEVTPDLTGSGQSVALEVTGGSAGTGIVSLNGRLQTLIILKTGDVALSGVSQTKESQGYSATNAGKLHLAVKVRRSDTFQSKGFSVAAIPVGVQDTFKNDVTTGKIRGMVVGVTVNSDSGNIADLKDVQYKEQVEIKDEQGVFKGSELQVAGWLDVFPPRDTDTHAVPLSRIAFPGGKLVLQQTQEFRDQRTGAQDIPIANSGYTIEYIVYGHARLNPWYLFVLKTPHAGTANNITSGSGKTFTSPGHEGDIHQTLTNP
jgi:hypothetical protein